MRTGRPCTGEKFEGLLRIPPGIPPGIPPQPAGNSLMDRDKYHMHFEMKRLFLSPGPVEQP